MSQIAAERIHLASKSEDNSLHSRSDWQELVGSGVLGKALSRPRAGDTSLMGWYLRHWRMLYSTGCAGRRGTLGRLRKERVLRGGEDTCWSVRWPFVRCIVAGVVGRRLACFGRSFRRTWDWRRRPSLPRGHRLLWRWGQMCWRRDASGSWWFGLRLVRRLWVAARIRWRLPLAGRTWLLRLGRRGRSDPGGDSGTGRWARTWSVVPVSRPFCSRGRLRRQIGPCWGSWGFRWRCVALVHPFLYLKQE